MSKGLRVIELRAENVKKLKAIEIRPEDNTVVISGRNEQGKSSVLDSIWYALGGKDAMKGLKKPIRDGEEKAQITVDLGDIIVTRKWTGNDKSYLTVENKDGATFKSPQSILDNLIGNLSFDPLAFSHMSDKEQKETLLDLVDIGIDLDEWEEDRQKLYDDRTQVNRKVKEREGQLVGLPESNEDTPDEETSASSILAEIQKAQKVKEENDEKRRGLTNLRQGLSGLEEDMVEIDADIASLIEQLAVAEKNKETLKGNTKRNKETLMKLNSETAALVDPDIAVFQKKLENIEEVNRAVREKIKRSNVQDQLDSAKKASEGLTGEIAVMDQGKDDAIKNAAFPIEGLGFDEMGVTYKSIPFGQCSAAESLRVSLSIAMSINPKLKVLRITDGSLLDSKNMKVIKEMVKENDYQLWLEQVMDSPDGASVYIEDGEIKEVS